MDPGPFFYHQSTIYYLLFTKAITIFHTICLILCFSKTGEIDNLTVSWGKVLWLCCGGFQVGNNTLEVFPCSYWFDNLSFITEGKLVAILIVPSSWGSPTSSIRVEPIIKEVRLCLERGWYQTTNTTRGLPYSLVNLTQGDRFMPLYFVFCFA